MVWTSACGGKRLAHSCTRQQRVIAPSRDAAERIGRHLPGLAIDVWPHPEPARTAFPEGCRALRCTVAEKGSPSSLHAR
jgi:hypothetical protein